MILASALAAPMVVMAQDRPPANKVYQDQSHKDSHEWNNEEDQRYRAYLQEHDKKYRDFNKLSAKDQAAYWEWRHQHDH